MGSEQTIQTVVINPVVQAAVVDEPLTHAALSHWLYRVSDSVPQNEAGPAADFGAAFGV